MKATVIAKCSLGDVKSVVDVDEATFRNLAKKGKLEPADAASKAVDLTKASRLSPEVAKQQINQIIERREALKAAA